MKRVRAVEIRMPRFPSLVLVAALVAPLAAFGQDYPKLRPGSWELTRKSDRPDDKGQRTTICTDESLQREMWDMGLGAVKGMCSKTEFKLSGNKGNADFVCNLGNTTMRSKAVMTFSGDTGYRTEIDTTYEPPLNGQARAHSVLESRWLGACKPGQQPGDMLLPNGQTINMRNALGGARK